MKIRADVFRSLNQAAVLPVILCCFSFFFGCSKHDEAPQQYNSYDYRMDGSRLVPDVGVPSTSTAFTLIDSNAGSHITAPPVGFPVKGKYLYLLAEGNKLVAGDEHSSEIIATTSDTKPIIQLLTSSTTIIAIGAGGSCYAYDMSGKLLWQYNTSGFDESDPRCCLSENALIAESDSAITAIDLQSGKSIWSYHTLFSARTLHYDSRSKLIIASLAFDGDAVSTNDSTQHHACDSILCFDLAGKVRSRFGAAKMRLISNLCLCGKNADKLAFGYISKPDSGEMRTLHVTVYSGIEEGNPKKISDHTLSYLPTQLGSNGSTLLTSGFYGTGTSLESGIDAFYADDTIHLWERHFTYPVTAPVAISDKYGYFTLSFTTQAEVAARSIFYTLDLTTGKTIGELPVSGALTGFMPAMPMPVSANVFILADRNKPTIYFLRP
jgi:outer membrane protein assembly factor BamB